MIALFDRLLKPNLRERIVQDCTQLLDMHLHTLSGVRGLIIKAAFDTLTRFRPDFVPRVLNRLLPDFLLALDDAYRSDAAGATPATGDFSAFMLRRPEVVVAALLLVSDRKVERLDYPLVKRLYARLRNMAEHEIAAILPDLAEHLPEWLHDAESMDEAGAYLA